VKSSRFPEEQIASARQQAETGTPVAEVLRRMGISEQAYPTLEEALRGLGTGELQRFRPLEQENRELKQLAADLSLDTHLLQVRPRDRRLPERPKCRPIHPNAIRDPRTKGRDRPAY